MKYDCNELKYLGHGVESVVYVIDDITVLKTFRNSDCAKQNRLYAKLFEKLGIGVKVLGVVEKVHYSTNWPCHLYGYICERATCLDNYIGKIPRNKINELEEKIKELTLHHWSDSHNGNMGFVDSPDNLLCIDCGVGISIGVHRKLVEIG